MEADTVNAFKCRLDKHWSNQDVLFDFNAELTGTGSVLTGMRQGSHKPGKPGIVREFCKPGKVREFEIWSGNFFITCHVVRNLLIDELSFACNV